MSHPLAGTIRAGKCAECGHNARPDEVTECRFCDPPCPHHRAARPREPMTPPQAEAALEDFQAALDDAEALLIDARNAELAAEEARDKAEYEALLSPDCPRVGVFDGVRTTVAMQAAWVAREIAAEADAFRAAKVVRQAAKDHFDKVRAQLSGQQSISRSVADSYRGQREPGW